MFVPSGLLTLALVCGFVSLEIANSPKPTPHGSSNDDRATRSEQLAEMDKAKKLGLFHLSRKDHRLARQYLVKSQEICKEVLGDRHPVFAWHLNVLGCLDIWTKKHDRAELQLKQALEVFAETLGKDHAAYVEVQTNLGGLLLKMNRLDEARPHLERVLAYTMQEGDEHPNYAAAAGNLGLLFVYTKDYGRAEPLLRQSMENYKKLYGDSHITHAASMQRLGRLYLARADYQQAEICMRKALSICDKRVSPQDPFLAECLENCAEILEATNRQAEAVRMRSNADSIRKQRLRNSENDQ